MPPDIPPVSVNVRFLSDNLFIEVTVVECTSCFALVREEKLGDHFRSHDDN